MKNEEDLSERPPDIFRAAELDDVAEMKFALEDGQSLDNIDKFRKYSAVHLACERQSTKFLEAAFDHGFNPWVRDVNQRLPLDYAMARGLRAIQERLFRLMYDEKWKVEVDKLKPPLPEI